MVIHHLTCAKTPFYMRWSSSLHGIKRHFAWNKAALQNWEKGKIREKELHILGRILRNPLKNNEKKLHTKLGHKFVEGRSRWKICEFWSGRNTNIRQVWKQSEKTMSETLISETMLERKIYINFCYTYLTKHGKKRIFSQKSINFVALFRKRVIIRLYTLQIH